MRSLTQSAWYLLLPCVLAVPLAGSDDRPVPVLPTGQIVERVVTLDNEDQQYALYLPVAYGGSVREWPVLFVLDPRGRAVPGIERFLPAAERLGYVVLSSYQSRSDTFPEVTFNALNALLLDAQRRYRIDRRRFYLAGMSGTAHASWRFAQMLEDNVAGVIAAAGGVQTPTQGAPGEARFSYFGIIGTTDFNYQEMMRLEEHLLETGIDHRIEIFDGSHGWPPPELTNRALEWMELEASERGYIGPDDELFAAELARARAAAERTDDPLDRLRRYRYIVRDFGRSRDVDEVRAMVERFARDPRVEARRQQETKLAREEQTYLTARFGPWLAEMQSADRRPPTLKQSLVALRIAALRERSADQEDLFDSHSARRRLESVFTAVAFYLPAEFEKKGDLERIIRGLEVAVEIFPDRPRAHWRLAEANARAGRLPAAFAALKPSPQKSSHILSPWALRMVVIAVGFGFIWIATFL